MPYRDREERLQFMRDWDKRNRVGINRKVMIEYYQVKEEIFKRLGGKCCECGYSNAFGLEIDHIVALGRTKRINHGVQYYRNILADLKSFQLLCANCHAIKTYDDRRRLKKESIA